MKLLCTRSHFPLWKTKNGIWIIFRSNLHRKFEHIFHVKGGRELKKGQLGGNWKQLAIGGKEETEYGTKCGRPHRVIVIEKKIFSLINFVTFNNILICRRTFIYIIINVQLR